MIRAKLRAALDHNSYDIQHKPNGGRYGGPSAKPWHLLQQDDKGLWHHLASFATLEKAEDNFRARAAC